MWEAPWVQERSKLVSLATLLEVSIATPLEGKSVEGKSVDLDEVNGSVWVEFECLGGCVSCFDNVV